VKPAPYYQKLQEALQESGLDVGPAIEFETLDAVLAAANMILSVRSLTRHQVLLRDLTD
jgi:hypothetical protein